MTAASSTTEVDTAPGAMEKDVKDVKDIEDVKDVEDAKDVKDVDSTPTGPQEYPPLPKVIVIILALYLAVFLVALDQTIIGVAIPRITDQFKSITDIAW
jgi:hypothetical protein